MEGGSKGQGSRGPSHGKLSSSRRRRDGMDLQALEDDLRMEIDPAFFEPSEHFRPFNQVIEILSVSLDKDKDGEPGTESNHLAGNPLHKNIQRQLKVCSGVVERITVEHHSSLNSSVKAMGGVARHYNQTRDNVGTLREQLRECKQLLQTGASQTDVRELWQRKMQYSHVLRLLDALSMIKDAPVKFDRLVRQKRFVAAVGLLNASLLNIFSPELVDVPAVASVRDEMLTQKGKILDLLVTEIADVLFLRTAPGSYHHMDQTSGAAKGRRRRERGGALMFNTEESFSAPTAKRTQSFIAGTSRGNTKDITSEASDGMASVVPSLWAGLSVDVGDINEEDEGALHDPSEEFGVYLRLLVEAVRRLRYLDDVERYLLERLPDEILTLSASHMRACMPTDTDDTTEDSRGEGEGGSAVVQHLIQYLGLAFDSFVRVLVNHMHLVRLLHGARMRDLRESDPSAPVFEADAPYKEFLVLSLWQHIQIHIKDVLARHVAVPSVIYGGSGIEEGEIGADSSRDGSNRRGSDVGLLSKVSSALPFRPLRRPESTSSLLLGGTMELDKESAVEYCRCCMLANPSPFILVHIFRPTLKFVEVEQGKLKAMKKEVLGSGQGGRERGRRREAEDGYEDDTNGLSSFLHTTVQDVLLPQMAADSLATHTKVAEDPDSFFPRFMGVSGTSGSGAGAGVAKPRGVTAQSSASTREAISLSMADVHPTKGAEDIYAQTRKFFRAIIQMPQYGEQLGEVQRSSLETYFTLVSDKFQDLTDGSASRTRLERCGDKLRELLRRDAHYTAYKARIYGGTTPWDNEIIGKEGIPHLQKGQGYRSASVASIQGVRGREQERGRAETSTTAEEEADDVFESEFILLRDLWNFNAMPYPVAKKSLLSLRKQQAVACLGYSCDWLGHKLLKMCNALQQQQRQNRSSLDGPETGSGTNPGGKRGSPLRSRGFEGLKPMPGVDAASPYHKLSSMARKLSKLADDSLLCLRLEVFAIVSHYMHQLPSVDLGVDSGKGSTTAMSLGSVEDQCVVDLNRSLREEYEAFSPRERKGSLSAICSGEYLSFVLAPLPRLVPRLFVLSLSFTMARAITVGGVGKLNKIVKTLQQTVGDAIGTNQQSQDDNFSKSAGGTSNSSHGNRDFVAERFGCASQYVALLSMTQGELENFMRNNRTKFTKEEYRVQWLLVGPNRQRSDGGKGENFESWWASER